MSAKFRNTVTVNDQTFDQIVQVDSLNNYITTLALPAAKSGTLTTRTSNTVGVITLPVGHGVPTGTKVGLYWSTGQADADVGVVTGTTIAVTVISGGDNLPSSSSAITVGRMVETSIAMNTDNIKGIAISMSGAGKVVMRNMTDSLLSEQFSASGIVTWYDGSTFERPFLLSETTDAIQASTSQTGADQVARIVILKD
jgi:hypothetical protein